MIATLVLRPNLWWRHRHYLSIAGRCRSRRRSGTRCWTAKPERAHRRKTLASHLLPGMLIFIHHWEKCNAIFRFSRDTRGRLVFTCCSCHRGRDKEAVGISAGFQQRRTAVLAGIRDDVVARRQAGKAARE